MPVGKLTNFTFGVRGAAPVSITSATVSLVPNDHAFRAIVMNRTGGITATLPAATGSGDVYDFYFSPAVASTCTVKVANASDIMTGTALLTQDAADTVVGFETAADTDTVTINGATTGGLKGTHLVLVDISANTWAVSYVGGATGAEATPFSAGV